MAHQDGGKILAFGSRADIYLKTSSRSIRRALEKILQDKTQLAQITLRMQEILAAIACEMMVRDPADNECEEDIFAIRDIRDAAGRRLLPRCGSEFGEISDEDWNRLRQVTGLSQRGILRDCENWVFALASSPDDAILLRATSGPEFSTGLGSTAE